jgi:hypothetical protein
MTYAFYPQEEAWVPPFTSIMQFDAKSTTADECEYELNSQGKVPAEFE